MLALVLAACGRTVPYRLAASLLDAGVGGRLTDGGTCIASPTPTPTPWEIHLGEPPFCWGQTFTTNGDPGEYAFATIPPENDPGWMEHVAESIRFNQRSTLCGVDGGSPLCACRAGGDFTYFQTAFELGAPARELWVTLQDVDDGVEVTLFNDAHPEGVVVGHVTIGPFGGSGTPDFAAQSVKGHNRLVLTHVDDCCEQRRIANAKVILDGEPLEPCHPAP